MNAGPGPLMRAVVVRGPHHMALERRPRPTPGPEQVLVRVRYSACCATDFDLIDGTMPDQARYPMMARLRALRRAAQLTASGGASAPVPPP